MATVIVYRSRSASYAAQRVAKAAPNLRAVQEDSYRPQTGDRTVVRWDCYKNLPSVNANDINPADAVQRVRNKRESRRVLAELAPQTWFDKASIQVPCVIRPKQHKAGRKFFVVRAMNKVLSAVKRCGPGWYASRLINKRREFRVFVVRGRVVAVSERFPGNSTAIAWNLALGGRLINVARPEWPVPVLRASIEAMRRLGLGFGAVDAALDDAGNPVIFESNTSPALRNKFTIKQIAKGLAWTGEIKPIKDGASKARSYAHPAVLKEGE